MFESSFLSEPAIGYFEPLTPNEEDLLIQAENYLKLVAESLESYCVSRIWTEGGPQDESEEADLQGIIRGARSSTTTLKLYRIGFLALAKTTNTQVED